MSICPDSSPEGIDCPATIRENQELCPENSVCIDGVRHSIHWETIDGEEAMCTLGDEGAGHVYEKNSSDT